MKNSKFNLLYEQIMNNLIDYSDIDITQYPSITSSAQKQILQNMISWIKQYQVLRDFFPGYLDAESFKAKYIYKIGILSKQLPTDKSKLSLMEPLPQNLTINYPAEIPEIIVSFKDNTLNNNSYIYGKFNNLKFSNRYGYVIFITDPLDIQEI